MRKVRKGKVSRYALDVIAKNYDRLKQLCNYNDRGCYCSKSYEDIFQDTILYVIHDKEASCINNEEEMIKHFCYRYKMIEFQTINDDKELREVKYADYLQTKEGNQEE